MSQKLPFDLELLDKEKQRRVRRRKLLFYSLPGILLLSVVSIWLVLPTISTKSAMSAYDSKQYKQAKQKLAPAKLATMQRYLYLYNDGTSLSANKEYEAAIARFEAAFAYVKNSDSMDCKIAVNLVLTLEKWADDLVANKRQPEAIDRYVKALSFIADRSDCFEGTQTEERIAAKLKAVRDAEVSPDKNDDTKQDDKQPDKSQQEKLKEKELQAQQERKDRENSATEHPNNDNKIDYKQW